MSAFIVATVRITDPQQFAIYAKAISGLSERFGGEPIVRGAVVDMLEGDGSIGERVVVSRYPDAAAAHAYISSAEYRAAAVHRIGAAEVIMRLVEA